MERVTRLWKKSWRTGLTGQCSCSPPPATPVLSGRLRCGRARALGPKEIRSGCAEENKFQCELTATVAGQGRSTLCSTCTALWCSAEVAQFALRFRSGSLWFVDVSRKSLEEHSVSGR